jgi:hypothetical protein
MPPKVERDNMYASEPRNNPQPIPEMAGEPVQEDDLAPLSRFGVGEPVRAPIVGGPGLVRVAVLCLGGELLVGHP